MHELSIAQSIVEIACEEAHRHNDARVEAVHLKLGALAGVVKDALLFSWEIACQDTPLTGARLEIEDIPVCVWCPECSAEQAPVAVWELRCPVCGSPSGEVRRGRELQVAALEIAEADT